MSLSNLVARNNTFEEVDPGYISEAAMNQLCGTIVMETLNPEEMEQYLSESSMVPGAVTEAQKNIVRLNKEAKMNRAFKVGVLQCAAEANDKDYKKIRKLWKLEAKLYKKMEQKYHNKALAKAREAIKAEKKKKNNMSQVVTGRIEKVMTGTNNLMKSGPVKVSK